MDTLIKEATLETSVGEEYDVNTGNELPTRGIVQCVIFEQIDDRTELRDLECLDGEEPMRVGVLGRLVKLSEEGFPLQATVDGLDSSETGPLVRLDVSEWSVEYDELVVTVWVSTSRADYKLLSASPVYESFWSVLQRKTMVAARAIGLLSEDPSPTFKQLAKSILRLNSVPGFMKLRPEDIYDNSAFLAEQLSNSDGLADCKAITGLRQEIIRRSSVMQLSKSPTATAAADEESSQNGGSTADCDTPGKRQRKAPTSLLMELEDKSDAIKRAKATAKQKSKDDGKKDPNAPKSAQSAFMYFSKQARLDVQAEADSPLSFTEIGKLVAERWKQASAEEKAEFEAIAAADKERYVLEMRWYQDELEALEKVRPRKKNAGRQNGMLACERESPKKRKTEELDADVKREDSRRDSAQLIEEHTLLEREQVHRKMLVASGRSKPPLEDSGSQADYIYPPRAPYPAVLPPMPEMPAAVTLIPPAGLPLDSMQQILMLWDSLNKLGVSYKLCPLSIPLSGLLSGLRCTDAVDYALISTVHFSMMKAISRDVEGLEGWGPWARALKEPLITLIWPALLSQLLQVDPFFEQMYDQRSRDEIVDALNTSEWSALRPELRLQLLVWLADSVNQCETVRAYLEKNAELSTDLRREIRAMHEEESAQAALLAEAQLRVKVFEEKLLKQQAVKQQSERKRSLAKAAAATAAAAAAGLRGCDEEMARVATESATLRAMRRRRVEKQLLLDSMPLRSEVVGTDRFGRSYVQLGNCCGEPTALLLDPEGRWARVRGQREVRQLFAALHPDGTREGALRQAMCRGPLAAVLDADETDDESHRPSDSRQPATPSKPPPSLYAPLRAPEEGTAFTNAASSAGLSEAARADLSRRCLSLASSIDKLGAADAPLQRIACEALAKLGAPESVASLRPLPRCVGPQLEILRLAVREFEARLQAAGQVWTETRALQQPWELFVRTAALPIEFAHALLVLDANMAASVRSRTWGVERSSRWRAQVVACSTIASVAQQLLLLDECCAWDYIERQLADPKKLALYPHKTARGAPRVRPRMGVVEFAASIGERIALLEWCEQSPAPDVLRANVGGDLFSLSLEEGGVWRWTCYGKQDPVYALNLRGLTAAEAKGERLTVWYEEERDGKLVDVPYTGVVLSVHMRDGMAVQFDHTKAADGTPEELVIGNEDDWMWGVHHNKTSKQALLRSS